MSVGLRPSQTPFATARARPSPVRAQINSRSNSARPPSTISIKRPCAVVVSAHVSLSERNPAPLPVTAASGLCALVLRIVRRIQRITLALAAHITAVQRVERTDLCLRVLLLQEALQQEEAELAA